MEEFLHQLFGTVATCFPLLTGVYTSQVVLAGIVKHLCFFLNKLYQHRPQIAQANLCVINVEKGAAENGVTLWSIVLAIAPSNGTPAWHPAIVNSASIQQWWHPAMAPQQWHPAMAPSNGNQQWHPQQWHRAMAPSKSTPAMAISNSTPAMAPNNGTPAMAPSNGTLPKLVASIQQWHPSNGTQHGPAMAPSNGTQQWHPQQWHRAMAPSNSTPAMAISNSTPAMAPNNGTPAMAPSNGTPPKLVYS